MKQRISFLAVLALAVAAAGGAATGSTGDVAEVEPSRSRVQVLCGRTGARKVVTEAQTRTSERARALPLDGEVDVWDVSHMTNTLWGGPSL
jgi:hypothetical protein